MKNLKNVINDIERFAPPNLAQFDYTGLICGELDQEIRKIGLTLDFSLTAIKIAIEAGCDLLITHHGPSPDFRLAFPINGLMAEKLSVAKRNKLAIYRAHLNLDFCKGGMIDTMCEIMELKGEPCTNQYHGIEIVGGVYLAQQKISLKELIERCKRFNPVTIRTAGVIKKDYERIAITSGGGFIPEFFEQIKPDVYIAGEFEHEAVVAAYDLGITLIEISHYSTEVVSLKVISKRLEKKIKIPVVDIDIGESIKLVYSENMSGS